MTEAVLDFAVLLFYLGFFLSIWNTKMERKKHRCEAAYDHKPLRIK